MTIWNNINSLVPVTRNDFKNVISNHIVGIKFRNTSCEIAFRWMTQALTDDQSTLVQVMVWCHQTASHYLSQCWSKSMLAFGITRLQRVKYTEAWTQIFGNNSRWYLNQNMIKFPSTNCIWKYRLWSAKWPPFCSGPDVAVKHESMKLVQEISCISVLKIVVKYKHIVMFSKINAPKQGWMSPCIKFMKAKNIFKYLGQVSAGSAENYDINCTKCWVS